MIIKVKAKKLIIISGTPATGKSSIAEILVKKLGLVRIDWHDLVKKNKKLSSGYDHKKKCYALNMNLLEKVLQKVRNDSPNTQFLFDSHVAHYLPKEMVKLAIVMKCSNLKKLRARLENRKYSKAKVEENLQCEIFDVCYDEAKEAGHNVLVFDTCKRIVQKDIVAQVKKKLSLK